MFNRVSIAFASLLLVAVTHCVACAAVSQPIAAVRCASQPVDCTSKPAVHPEAGKLNVKLPGNDEIDVKRIYDVAPLKVIDKDPCAWQPRELFRGHNRVRTIG